MVVRRKFSLWIEVYGYTEVSYNISIQMINDGNIDIVDIMRASKQGADFSLDPKERRVMARRP